MSTYTGLEIAIIGISGKFPGADNVQSFWNNLKNGVESVEFFSPEELEEGGVSKRFIQHENYVNANAYLKNKEFFDADFFGYIPDEAKIMDPQMRLFHQVCWEAIEDAGCNLEDAKNKIGLFAGAAPNLNWEMYASVMNEEGLVDDFSAFQLRNARFLASKISYAFNLKGVSMFVDTACSTSLVAVHQACRSLLVGDCNIAIAGGVTVTNKSKRGYMYQEGMINSKDGHCKAFDANSSGTVGGEGAGVVILKPLKQAIKDRDNIHAIIRGTGVNNDGDSKVGYTAPSIDGQMEAIMTAQKWAKVAPETISYIEAHGTGTILGDPIEIAALKKAFNTDKKQFCAIGSVKTNIGHLDTASGITGLIKTVLALKNKQLPPSLHYNNPNPSIDFENSPFYVNTKLQEWSNGDTPLRAGVSSFGIGGTNAHVILEEAPTQEKSKEENTQELIVLSGKTPEALQRNIDNFTTYLKTNTTDSLADIAYTLKTGRSSLPYRKSFVSHDKESVLNALANETLFADELKAASNTRNVKIAFMFSGQGSQYQNMCRDLYKNEPIFKENLDACLHILKNTHSKDLSTIIFSSEKEASTAINETENTQPALFIVEYALAKLLISWGIVPEIMIGHSIGEYATACISGVFTLEEALSIVVKRGELMQKMSRGSMLSISIAEAELATIVKEQKNISLAAVNSSELCVVSGTDDAIAAFKSLMESKGYTCRDIKTSHAFHSYMMDDMLEAFENEFKHINLQKPSIPFVSNLTGEIADNEVITAAYWVRHLRETVQFSKGIANILKTENVVFIEVGPGKVLSYLTSTHKNKTEQHTVVNLVRNIKEDRNDQAYLLAALGTLWEYGIAPNWTAFYKDKQRYKVSLPTYDFEKVAYPVNVDAIELITEKFDTSFANNHEDININTRTWKSTLLPNRLTTSTKNTEAFLVFSGEEKLSATLVKTLRNEGKFVVEIQQANEFNVQTETTLQADFQQLTPVWEYLEKSNIKFNHIIYNAALSEKLNDTSHATIDETLNTGYVDICSIAKSMPKLDRDEEVSITIFNNHTTRVFENDALNALKTTALAPVKVIPSEIFQLRCKLVDIPYPFKNESDTENYTQKLINELGFETQSQSPLVAYRHQQRWIPTYEEFVPNKQLQSSAAIIKDGFYLITGGFGGMGFSIAEDLVCNKDANVIIVHRSPFPKRSEWETLLAQENEATEKQAETLQKIKTLLAMETTGKSVAIHQADISKETEVQKLIEDIQKTYSTINGLIWAAGEVDYGGIVLNRSIESLRSYCSSKIDGVLLFEKYLDFSSLDFISLFSSIGNVFYQSKFGQVAYNAANEFMEAYAIQLSEKLNNHTFAINWCDWLNVGMTIKTIQKQQETATIENINNQVLHGIYPEEGVDVFYQCLKNKNKSSTILRGDLNKTIKSYEAEYQKRKEEFTKQTTEDAEIATETFDSIEEMLIVTFNRFFGKTDIGINDDFFELGGDSLKGMTITARINQQIGSSLSIADLYEYPTVKLLEEFLSKSKTQNKISQIPKIDKKELYNISSAQRRMYFMQSLDKDNTAYNETQILQVDGILDKNQLIKSLERLVNRHESLRTNFELLDGAIVQKIQEEININVEKFEANEADIDSVVKGFVRPFCLKTEPLFRFGIIVLSEEKHIIMLDIHHIVTDGISNNILINDLLAFYNGENLPELKLQYKDYAEWQQSDSEQERIAEQKQFWLQEFEGELPVLDLPLDYQRPINRSNNGDFIEFSLTKSQTKTLKSIAETQGISMFMLLLSLYNILLSKLTNQKDIVVGTPTSGRTHADVENMFGMFVNMLPIRNDVQTTKKFNAFLQEVKQKILSTIENQEFQYEDIIEALDVQRDVNREALFDVVFTFRNFEESAKNADGTNAISGLEFSNYYQNKQTAKFDLKLESSEQNDNLVLAFEYRTDIFKKATIQRFVKYFKNIVSEISSNPHIEVGAIDILSEVDKKQLLFDFNKTKTAYPSTESIDVLFSKQVAKTPNKIAVSYKDVQLTYEELETYSNQLANYLIQDHKITKGDIVAIVLERSQWLPVVTLAILKTGAAYLPLDPSYPGERIDLIKEDSNFKVAVNEELLKAFLTEESLSKSITFNVKTTADDLAYIMYTSGSTGTPKAVMIPNKAIVRLVKSTNYFNFETTDKLISTGALSFDATTFEYWGMLLNGGELILCDQDVLLQSEELQNEIRNRGVTAMWFTAGWGNQLIDDHIELFKGLETVLLGGEKLSPRHIQKLRNTYPALQIINGYGPTENTTFSLTYDISDVTEIIPIGTPISNSTAYILNDHLQLQPVGVVGEIYLGGDGLAKGYLNDPEKTAEKFIENPYKKGETIYKSGDLGMWLPDGNIRYMGRNDNQVKIRGHRIELGEIEQVLQTQEHIAQVAVTVKTINDDKVIIAYILSEEETINKEALKIELKQVLPEYMIPRYFVEVTEMPLNANGKVDYKALPELQASDMILTEYVAASTETEKTLVDIWKNLLQFEKIGIKDNFFEIGGHSIKAIKLSHEISTAFGLDISIKNIFVHATIEQLAAQIDITKKQQEAITSNIELNEIEI